MALTKAEVNSYFHSNVDMGYGTSADYVVAHAARQQKKGRRPSVAYRNISNPALALEAAREDIEARETKTFNGVEAPFYLADFSGRVAIMHASDDERQKEFARMFVDARVKDGRCIGAIILNDFDEIDYTMAAHQINPNGTTEVPYLYAP
jgi:hypothetical protein